MVAVKPHLSTSGLAIGVGHCSARLTNCMSRRNLDDVARVRRALSYLEIWSTIRVALTQRTLRPIAPPHQRKSRAIPPRAISVVSSSCNIVVVLTAIMLKGGSLPAKGLNVRSPRLQD